MKPDAEGHFKRVYFVPNDGDAVVVQTFQRMTLSQRSTELVGLLLLSGEPHMGQIKEVLKDDENNEIIGLSMARYQKTLKEYTRKHSHHHLTACQKMDLIVQMLRCMEVIHGKGLAHRDLSELNFMVNEAKERVLDDGSVGADVYLIDFGKACFIKPELFRQWWRTTRPKSSQDEFADDDLLPKTEEQVESWCKNLPWVTSKPDHGFRHYRSIQTLPRTHKDHDILPWQIHPAAEDIYSLGALLWKVFTETQPWNGILDTELKELRETVKSDFAIDMALERQVCGELSKELLRFCLRVNPLERKSAAEILKWISQPHIQEGLLKEWTDYAPASRTKRHPKVRI